MNKLIGACLFVILIAIGWQLDIQLTIAEKINKAFPPRAEVRIQLETMESLIPSDDPSLKLFKSNYGSKLTLRALTCTQGHSISHFDSIKSIKKLAIDRDCLKEQDDQLQELIGLKLVGFRLAQPPLKPLVKLGTPAVIHGADGVEIYMGKSASKAGVAVLRGTRNEFISVEIPSGKKIASLPTMPEASQTNYSLSPNGRILAIPVNNKDLRFVDNETGQELWLARDMNQTYVWLPEIQAALVRENKSGNGNGGVLLIDFKIGAVKPYSVAQKNQSWALHISESPSRLLIGSYRDFSLIENSRSPEGVDSTVVKDYKIKSPRGSVSSLTPTLMLDGEAIVFVTGRDFMLFNLETRDEKTWESSEIIGNNYAKLSEDSLLVDAYGLSGTVGTRPYVFNIKDSTLSAVETTEGNEGIVYELDGRTGFMRRGYQKVWIGDELQVGKGESLDTMIAGRKLEKQLQALEHEERIAKARDDALKTAQDISRMQRQMGADSATNTNLAQLRETFLRQAEQSGYASAAPMAPATEAAQMAPSMNMYGAGANEARRQAILNTTNRMLGNIPSNARVEAVGVYETKDRSPAGINVIVKKSEEPIVLMLSAYEPVRWNLIKESGANLAAVIATGYNLPQVTGAGTTKTVIKRGNYAYQQSGSGYAALNNDAMMWTGKPISKFQGAYGGTVFVVGN